MDQNPFQSPTEAEPLPPESGALREFRSVATLATVSAALLGCCAALDVLTVVSDFMQLSLLDRAASGSATQDEIDQNDTRVMLAGAASFAVYIVSGIVFFRWLYRSHKNLPSLGISGLDFSPGSTIGWWFVPFANLFKPYQAVVEVWKASSPSHLDAENWKSSPRSALVGTWWMFWLLNNVVSQVSSRMSNSANNVPSLQTSTAVDIAASIISLVAAVLAIQVVLKISRNQDTKYARLSGIPTEHF